MADKSAPLSAKGSKSAYYPAPGATDSKRNVTSNTQLWKKTSDNAVQKAREEKAAQSKEAFHKEAVTKEAVHKEVTLKEKSSEPSHGPPSNFSAGSGKPRHTAGPLTGPRTGATTTTTNIHAAAGQTIGAGGTSDSAHTRRPTVVDSKAHRKKSIAGAESQPTIASMWKKVLKTTTAVGIFNPRKSRGQTTPAITHSEHVIDRYMERVNTGAMGYQAQQFHQVNRDAGGLRGAGRYLAKDVGQYLVQCLKEVCEVRPRDPIEFIAHWLYKSVDAELYFYEKIIFNKECMMLVLDSQRRQVKKMAIIQQINSKMKELQDQIMRSKMEHKKIIMKKLAMAQFDTSLFRDDEERAKQRKDIEDVIKMFNEKLENVREATIGVPDWSACDAWRDAESWDHGDFRYGTWGKSKKQRLSDVSDVTSEVDMNDDKYQYGFDSESSGESEVDATGQVQQKKKKKKKYRRRTKPGKVKVKLTKSGNLVPSASGVQVVMTPSRLDDLFHGRINIKEGFHQGFHPRSLSTSETLETLQTRGMSLDQSTILSQLIEFDKKVDREKSIFYYDTYNDQHDHYMAALRAGADVGDSPDSVDSTEDSRYSHGKTSQQSSRKRKTRTPDHAHHGSRRKSSVKREKIKQKAKKKALKMKESVDQAQDIVDKLMAENFGLGSSDSDLSDESPTQRAKRQKKKQKKKEAKLKMKSSLEMAQGALDQMRDGSLVVSSSSTSSSDTESTVIDDKFTGEDGLPLSQSTIAMKRKKIEKQLKKAKKQKYDVLYRKTKYGEDLDDVAMMSDDSLLDEKEKKAKKKAKRKLKQQGGKDDEVKLTAEEERLEKALRRAKRKERKAKQEALFSSASKMEAGETVEQKKARKVKESIVLLEGALGQLRGLDATEWLDSDEPVSDEEEDSRQSSTSIRKKKKVKAKEVAAKKDKKRKRRRTGQPDDSKTELQDKESTTTDDEDESDDDDDDDDEGGAGILSTIASMESVVGEDGEPKEGSEGRRPKRKKKDKKERYRSYTELPDKSFSKRGFFRELRPSIAQLELTLDEMRQLTESRQRTEQSSETDMSVRTTESGMRKVHIRDNQKDPGRTRSNTVSQRQSTTVMRSRSKVRNSISCVDLTSTELEELRRKAPTGGQGQVQEKGQGKKGKKQTLLEKTLAKKEAKEREAAERAAREALEKKKSEPVVKMIPATPAKKRSQEFPETADDSAKYMNVKEVDRKQKKTYADKVAAVDEFKVDTNDPQFRQVRKYTGGSLVRGSQDPPIDLLGTAFRERASSSYSTSPALYTPGRSPAPPASSRSDDLMRKFEEIQKHPEDKFKKYESTEQLRKDEEARLEKEEARKKEQEARRKDPEYRRKEDERTKRKEEEAKRKEEEAQRKEEEAKRKEEEAKRKEEEEKMQRKVDEEQRKVDEERHRKRDEERARRTGENTPKTAGAAKKKMRPEDANILKKIQAQDDDSEESWAAPVVTKPSKTTSGTGAFQMTSPSKDDLTAKYLEDMKGSTRAQVGKMSATGNVLEIVHDVMQKSESDRGLMESELKEKSRMISQALNLSDTMLNMIAASGEESPEHKGPKFAMPVMGIGHVYDKDVKALKLHMEVQGQMKKKLELVKGELANVTTSLKTAQQELEERNKLNPELQEKAAIAERNLNLIKEGKHQKVQMLDTLKKEIQDNIDAYEKAFSEVNRTLHKKKKIILKKKLPTELNELKLLRMELVRLHDMKEAKKAVAVEHEGEGEEGDAVDHADYAGMIEDVSEAIGTAEKKLIEYRQALSIAPSARDIVELLDEVEVDYDFLNQELEIVDSQLGLLEQDKQKKEKAVEAKTKKIEAIEHEVEEEVQRYRHSIALAQSNQDLIQHNMKEINRLKKDIRKKSLTIKNVEKEFEKEQKAVKTLKVRTDKTRELMSKQGIVPEKQGIWGTVHGVQKFKQGATDASPRPKPSDENTQKTERIKQQIRQQKKDRRDEIMQQFGDDWEDDYVSTDNDMGMTLEEKKKQVVRQRIQEHKQQQQERRFRQRDSRGNIPDDASDVTDFSDFSYDSEEDRDTEVSEAKHQARNYDLPRKEFDGSTIDASVGSMTSVNRYVDCQWSVLDPVTLVCHHPHLGRITSRRYAPRLHCRTDLPSFWKEMGFHQNAFYHGEIYTCQCVEDTYPPPVRKTKYSTRTSRPSMSVKASGAARNRVGSVMEGTSRDRVKNSMHNMSRERVKDSMSMSRERVKDSMSTVETKESQSRDGTKESRSLEGIKESKPGARRKSMRKQSMY